MRFWLGLFFLGVALQILVGSQAWPGVFAGSLNDPDSYMRLERIFQGIQTGHLVNIVARDDSGAGVLVEWSRLLDALIWAMAAPLAPFLGWRHALFAAGVTLGPLGAGSLAVALAFAAAPFSARRFLWFVPVATMVLPGLRIFEIPGVVHYHVLLLALIALTAGLIARAWKGNIGYGFLAGVCGGFAIWLTPETMPFVLMSFAILLFRWWQAPVAICIAAGAAGFCDVLIFGLAIDPPEGGYGVAEIDRLSIVYVVLGLLVLAGGLALWRLERWQTPRPRQIIGTGLMAALIIFWIALFPKVAMGPYGIMSPADMRRFFGVMLELQPVLKPDEIVEYMLPGALALLYAIMKCLDTRDIFSVFLWAYISICTLVALVLGQRFLLFVEFAAGIAAVLLPVALTDFSNRLLNEPMRAMLARISIIFLVFVLPVVPALAAQHPKTLSGRSYPTCSLRHIDHLLAPYAGAIILAEVDDTPELLYRTKILTVGSLYQHGVPGYLRAREAWRSDGGVKTPSAAVMATGSKFILFCPQKDRYTPVADLPQMTLWDAFENNQPPVWVKLETQDSETGWRLYQIIP